MTTSLPVVSLWEAGGWQTCWISSSFAVFWALIARCISALDICVTAPPHNTRHLHVLIVLNDDNKTNGQRILTKGCIMGHSHTIKTALSLARPRPPPNAWFLGPSLSTPQKTSRSVHLFLYGSWLCPSDRQAHREIRLHLFTLCMWYSLLYRPCYVNSNEQPHRHMLPPCEKSLKYTDCRQPWACPSMSPKIAPSHGEYGK